MSIHSQDRKTQLRKAEYYARLCRESLAKDDVAPELRVSTAKALVHYEARIVALSDDASSTAEAPYGGLCVP